MPQAPRSKSFTSRYFRRAAHPSTSQFCGDGAGGNDVRPVLEVGESTTFGGSADTGTQKEIIILGSDPADESGSLVVEIQRYIFGGTGNTEPSSAPSSASASRAIGVGRSSAVARAFRFPRGRVCFFRRRLIVSA